jgi:hypothetical protein
VSGILLGVTFGSIAAITISLPFWQHGAFPRELAESTPNSVFEVEAGSPGEWAYLDEKTLSVMGEEIPMECAITGEGGARLYCIPLSASPTRVE